MNMEKVFVDHLAGKGDVLCASIEVDMGDTLEDGVWVENVRRYLLPIGFGDYEFEAYVNSLDFEYDDTTIVDGTIWYTDGTWSFFVEDYDSVWWEHFKVPGVPEELRGK